MTAKPTTELAREWMRENMPPQSRVLLERYTPALPKDWYRLFLVTHSGEIVPIDPQAVRDSIVRVGNYQIGRLGDTGSISGHGIEYMVLSGWQQRFAAERDRYPGYEKVAETYEKLTKMGTKIYEISSTPNVNRGQTIRIYRFD